MNTKLNNRIKKMAKEYYQMSFQSNDDFFNWRDTEFKKEFMACYREDDKFQTISKECILLMLRLNLSVRVVPLHMFGINVNYTELL